MFMKNKNVIFKIRRSKVTEYAALNGKCVDYDEMPQSWRPICVYTVFYHKELLSKIYNFKIN